MQMEDSQLELMSVKSFKLGDKVIEIGYEGLPVLGSTSVVAWLASWIIPIQTRTAGKQRDWR